MIKKISAILLALVLCLSVVVVPASAFELASSSNIAYEIQLDKEYYSAGETVTVSLYLHAKEGLEFGTGAIVIGCHSDVFDTTENVANDIKAGSAMSENAVTYYKDGPDVAWAWQSSTVLNNIISNNTEEENEKFDQFLKFAVNKQGSNGSHEFATNTKRGYSAEELNADVEAGIPFMTFQLKLRDDIADGTKIEIGVPTGPMAKNYTYMNYLKSPGTATTLVKTTAADSEVVWSTTSVIGTAYTAPVVSWYKNQIRFDMDNAGAYRGTFDYRVLAEVVLNDAAEIDLKMAGFVFNKGANATIDIDTALADVKAKYADANATTTYSMTTKAYLSTSFETGKYVMACVVNDIPDDAKTQSIAAVGYVVYEANGETCYALFDEAKTTSFSGLYEDYYSQQFPA